MITLRASQRSSIKLNVNEITIIFKIGGFLKELPSFSFAPLVELFTNSISTEMKLTEFLNNLMVQEMLEGSDVGDYLKHYRHKRRFREYIF